jgi:hypothetical protein
MVSKKNRDAESGLQIMTVITIIWSVGFFYWSRDGSVLGMDLGRWAYGCCSLVNLLLMVVFAAAWMFTRKENRVMAFLDGHFKTAGSVTADEIALRFGLKRDNAVRALVAWTQTSGIKGTYDQTTGVFSRESEPKEE